MAEEKQAKEAQPAYAAPLTDYSAVPADTVKPVILEQDGQPVFAVLPFEEYRRLRDMASTEHERRQAAWARLSALLEEVHSRPTDLTPEEIEAEITVSSLGHEVAELQNSAR
jgi:PHD/YefM family antitoxin component YafN of YafNO toxin-antitoxin module